MLIAICYYLYLLDNTDKHGGCIFFNKSKSKLKVTFQFKPSLTKNQAIQKLKHYCAYQERCHKEVKEKLYAMGLRKRETDEITSQLIEENYLNEERFAIQYAGGKFRMNHWGRVKIKYELKQKQVSDYCIKKALSQIDRDAYMQTLTRLGIEKRNTLKSETNNFVKIRKVHDYLLQKGFESDLIKETMDDMITSS